MGKITNLEQLAQTASAAKTFTSGLVAELAEAANRDIAAAKSAADAAKMEATQSAAGQMSAADKKKLDGIAAGANAYSLPAASASVRGGVKTGYTANGKNYPVQLSNEQMYVNVPWTDTNTTYTAASATPKAAGTAAVGTSAKYAREDHVHPAQTSLSGNAATATKLAAARNITIGGAAKSFDGSGPVSFTLEEIGAAPTESPVFTGSISMGRKADTTIGENSVAVGFSVEACYKNSHAEGCRTKAGKLNTVVKNPDGSSMVYNDASGMGAHAEGSDTKALENYSHAEGYRTEASGVAAHAEGWVTDAGHKSSHAGGFCTVTGEDYQYAIGSLNVKSDGYLVIGSGTNTNSRSNCFRVTKTGTYGVGAFNATGADYAELMEWEDGNPDNEDRCGRFVTLAGDKIRVASPADEVIMGIISGDPSVVGDVHDDQWNGMYLTDIFGRPLWEDVEVPDETAEMPDPENPEKTITQVIIPAHTEHRQKLNPDYDNSQRYEPRTKRKEWDAVGMLGKLVAVDDGSCAAGGYCTVGQGGVATVSESKTRYYVMKRLDESHIRVLIL